MTHKKVKSPKTTSQPEQQGAELEDLEHLEQHISQRIMRLGEDTLDISESQQEPGFAFSEPANISSFEEVPGYEFPILDGANKPYTSVYPPTPTPFAGSADLLRSVHDLSDEMTKSILNLNVRMTTMEENLSLQVDCSYKEIKKILSELKTQLNNATHQQSNRPAPGPGSAPGLEPEFINRFQTQLRLLEATIELSDQDLKKQVEEKQRATRDQVEQKMQVVERAIGKNREYYNRHFVSLAILLVVLVFIAGALISSSVDRLSAYIVQQIDSLHTELQSPSNQKPPEEGERLPAPR